MTKTESTCFSPKKRFVKRMFDDISVSYDFLNRVISFGLDGICRKMAVVNHKDDNLVLDICSGSGDMTVELLNQKDFKGTIVLGDFSPRMHMLARKKLDGHLNARSKRHHQGEPLLLFVYCDAEMLPFKDCSFDGVINGYSLRNLDNLRAFGLEINRILRPDGHSSFVDVAHPPNKVAAWIFHLYFYKLLPLISRIFTGKKYAYHYLSSSLEIFSKQDDVLQALMGDHLNGRYQNILKGTVAIYRLWK